MKNLENITSNVVIGSAFGDEGKGLITDYYASKNPNSFVVRFNGGSQAGHTVVSPTGERHVFNSFGSGTLIGSKTYLSQFFIVNPLTFLKEFDRLKSLNVSDIPTSILPIYIDPRAIVTTPYDMLINQMIETVRGNTNHGSCGLGINETIERSLHDEFVLYSSCFDFKEKYLNSILQDTLQKIKKFWVPRRLKELQLDISTVTAELQKLQEHLENPEIIKNWIESVFEFRKYVKFEKLHILKENNLDAHFIFEGAQGLLLDQDRGLSFPHLTRSNTGIKNVIAIAREIKIPKLDITYVSRIYATRHGSGPLPNEIKNLPYLGAYENTNVLNTFQGNFRYGILDINLLSDTIKDDLRYVNFEFPEVSVTLALTCMDQADNVFRYIYNGKETFSNKEDFIKNVGQLTGISRFLLSYGPTRTTIKTYLL